MLPCFMLLETWSTSFNFLPSAPEWKWTCSWIISEQYCSIDLGGNLNAASNVGAAHPILCLWLHSNAVSSCSFCMTSDLLFTVFWERQQISKGSWGQWSSGGVAARYGMSEQFETQVRRKCCKENDGYRRQWVGEHKCMIWEKGWETWEGNTES